MIVHNIVNIIDGMNMEETAAENIIKTIAILTAILSGQEEEAHTMVLEFDVIELFGTLTGLLISSMSLIADMHDMPIEKYIQSIGLAAARSV